MICVKYRLEERLGALQQLVQPDEVTNTEPFCVSCHEMEHNVFKEYQHTVHYTNRSGVRATCSDCHVPKEWGPKIVRKIRASDDLWHKVVGSVDTPEKLQAKRVELARGHGATLRSAAGRLTCVKVKQRDCGKLAACGGAMAGVPTVRCRGCSSGQP